MNRTVAILASPLGNPSKIGEQNKRTIRGAYRWAVRFKANPRDEVYMRRLLAERYPDAHVMSVHSKNDLDQHLENAEHILLLYPDAIGLGFSPLERRVRRLANRRAAIRAVTGRGREFLLTRPRLLALRVRRFLERTMLVEVIALPIFLVSTMVLLALDLLQGRR